MVEEKEVAPLESSLLRIMAHYPEKYTYIKSHLSEEHFLDPESKILFTVLSGLYEAHRQTALNQIGKEGEVIPIFMQYDYVQQNMAKYYDVYSAEAYKRLFAKTVEPSATEDKVKQILHEYQKKVVLPRIINEITNSLSQAVDGKIDIFQASEIAQDLLQKNIDSKKRVNDFSNYINNLNEFNRQNKDEQLIPLFGYLINRGELAVCFGPPSSAKTLWGFDFMDRVCSGEGGTFFGEQMPNYEMKGLIIQLELSAAQLNYRIKNRVFCNNVSIVNLDRCLDEDLDITLDVVIQMAKNFDIIMLDNYSALGDAGDISQIITAQSFVNKLKKYAKKEKKTFIVMMHTPKMHAINGIIEKNHLEGSQKVGSLIDALIGFGHTGEYKYLRNLKYRSSENDGVIKKFITEFVQDGDLRCTYLGEIDIESIKTATETESKNIKSGINYFDVFKDIFTHYGALKHSEMVRLLGEKSHTNTKPNAERFVKKAIELGIISKLSSGDYSLNYDFDKDFTF